MEFTNKQEATRHVKNVLKQEYIEAKAQMKMVKDMMKGQDNVDNLSLKMVKSLVKISIHLHNFNIDEARKEEIIYNKIVSDVLNEFLFNDVKPACIICDEDPKNNIRYMGEAEKDSENARQIGEAQKNTAKHINDMVGLIIRIKNS